MTSTVVIHPSALVRSALHSLTESSGHPVLAAVESVDTAVETCRRCRPELVIAAEEIGTRRLSSAIADFLAIDARVLVTYSGPTRPSLHVLLLAGASGCISIEDTDVAALENAITTVAAGQAVLHPLAVQAVLQQWRALRSGVPLAPESLQISELTARERDVLTAIVDGLSTKETSRRLAIAQKTVEAHKAKLFAKLGARNQAHAVSLARDKGFLDYGPVDDR